MAGVEIAGFVLAAFPLLISAAEDYREGFEPLLKWKRFRTEFIGFIDAVDIEKQLYDQMLERFLLSADVPHEELQRFMTNPDYEGWQRKDLVDVLQRRLGASYAVYMSTIKSMNKLMDELQEVLSLKNGKIDWADDGASRWDYQMKRIRLSFSKRGPRTLTTLETRNRKLRELLESNEKLESMRATRKDTSWGSIFECIRRHANSLHSALKRSWICECTVPHDTELQLQNRSAGGWASNFNVAFETHKDTEPSRRQEFIIRLKAEKGLDELSKVNHLLPVSNASPETQHLDVSKLRRNFESKSTPQVSILHRPSLATTSSDTMLITSHNGHTNKCTGKEGSENLPYRMLEKDASHSEKHNSRISHFLGKTKRRKTVRMDLSPPSMLPTQMVSAPPFLSPSSEPASGVDIQRSDLEIKDLCSRLRCLRTNSACLGYLVDDEQQFHELVTVVKGIKEANNNTYISLETLIRDTQITGFNRRERHKTASILASSLLQLQTTPWLPETFGKENIFFYKQDATIFFDHPFVRHSFTSTKTCQISTCAGQTSPGARFAARNSLNNLGIVLLEICYGQAIEDQAIRKRYLGPDGKPHEYTNFMTARDWAESVGEQEPEWENIIRCCISCMFEEKADWGNRKFTATVYESVVEPLEKMAMKWSKS
ncbi:hypothetical protein EG329_008825 [Mollisiaceae sp. DMI_Dod_QoI]|nr:hypothetical protein EG329_008825 [Helotiales sp. DMI_Dod_QoI]